VKFGVFIEYLVYLLSISQGFLILDQINAALRLLSKTSSKFLLTKNFILQSYYSNDNNWLITSTA